MHLSLSSSTGNAYCFFWSQAWEAWEAGLLTEELFDPSLIDGSQGMEIRRWVQVGLLVRFFGSPRSRSSG